MNLTSHSRRLLLVTVLLFLTRSSTTPSRNFTTSPKLSSNSTTSISSTVTNGDNSCSPSYMLNNSTSSGNRQGYLLALSATADSFTQSFIFVLFQQRTSCSNLFDENFIAAQICAWLFNRVANIYFFLIWSEISGIFHYALA